MSNILSTILPSFLTGLAFLTIFFLISLFLVVGIKAIILHFMLLLPKRQIIHQAKNEKPIPKERKKKAVVKTIEINPNEVDKIYFKKPS